MNSCDEAVKIPIPIEAGVVQTGQTGKACATELNTRKADCYTITKESIDMFLDDIVPGQSIYVQVFPLNMCVYAYVNTPA
jgi:hypothetical protein